MNQNPEQEKMEPTMGAPEASSKEVMESSAPEHPIDDAPQHDPHQEDVDNSADIKASPEVGEELSKVATSPKRNVFVFGMMALSFLFMGWKLLAPALTDDGPAPITDQAPLPQGSAAEMPIEIEDTAPPIPQLPEPPQLIAPTPPPPPVITEREQNIDELPPLPNQAPPPPPPGPSAVVGTRDAGLPTGVSLGGSDAEDAAARLEAKRKSAIHLFGGGGSAEAAVATANMTDAEKTQSSDFQKRGNLNYVLGKGKIIDAVIETAINSDHPEEVRAVITRDVYAESGKIILIPKGTRIFGEFTTESSTGYGRVTIKWNRIDLATGYTLKIDSPAVDALGRSGIQAVVDHKYKEQMANAVLSSAFSIAVAAGVDKLVPPVQSTQSAANVDQANNLQSMALSIFNDATIANPDTKRDKICLEVKNAFPDKTAAAFNTFNQACLTAATSSGTPQEKLNTIMTAVTSAATSLVSQTSQATTPTNKQKAADEAFKSLSSKMEDIVKQQELKPTITVDQGTPVKIFIKKDYLFPKDAVLRARVLR